MPGNTIELRGPPYSSSYQASVETRLVAGVMTLGTVKALEIGQSAAKLLRALGPMEKVQRLSGRGLIAACNRLKIESGPAERQP